MAPPVRSLRLLLSSLLLLAGTLATVPQSRAQAWSRDEGELFVSPGYYYYTTSQFTDDVGNVLSYDDDGRYQSHGFSVYWEYGLTPRLTLEGKLQGTYQRFRNDAGFAVNNASATDQEIGLRYALLDRAPYVASVGLLASVPWLYDMDTQPLPGFGASSIQASLSGGRNVTLGGLSGWSVADVRYRHYFEGVSDQVRGHVLLGLNLTDRWAGLVELNGTLGLDDDPFDVPVNPNVQSGYSLLKATLSGVYQFTPDHALQVGLYHDVVGRFSGMGGGVTASLWLAF